MGPQSVVQSFHEVGWDAPDAPGGKGGDLGKMFSHFMEHPEKKRAAPRARPRVATTRSLSVQVAFDAFVRNREFYEKIGSREDVGDRAPVQACVLLISGCQDNQLSSDGWINGLFTGTLRKVWADGAFTGDYRAFHHSILMRMPATQSPNYYLTGIPDPDFEAQRPFTITAAP